MDHCLPATWIYSPVITHCWARWSELSTWIHRGHLLGNLLIDDWCTLERQTCSCSCQLHGRCEWVRRLTSLERFPGASLTFDLMQDRTEQFMILVMTHLPFRWSRKVTPKLRRPFLLFLLCNQKMKEVISDVHITILYLNSDVSWTISCTMTSSSSQCQLISSLDPSRDYITCTNRQDILMGMFRPGSKSTWNTLPVEILLELCNQDNRQSLQVQMVFSRFYSWATNCHL